jgi:ABC-type phosphate/phosphonate transport system permease subunit
MKSKKPAGDVWKDIAIAMIAVILSAILSLLIALVAAHK